ncbi:PIN domain-containing protein [Candidatus Micrarchaeota archaeon]|nr:PIN domain-containing protein [Candidatus Micrarchaeota archaeon]
MNDNFFVDTNILVYAFDLSEKEKRKHAKRIVESVTSGKDTAFVSNQVLGELFTALTKKIEVPLSKTHAQIIVNGFIDSVHWKKINYTSATVSRAIETSVSQKTPFWDSLIAETMLENNVFVILTENSKDFKLKHITASNPFKSKTK